MEPAWQGRSAAFRSRSSSSRETRQLPSSAPMPTPVKADADAACSCPAQHPTWSALRWLSCWKVGRARTSGAVVTVLMSSSQLCRQPASEGTGTAMSSTLVVAQHGTSQRAEISGTAAAGGPALTSPLLVREQRFRVPLPQVGPPSHPRAPLVSSVHSPK